MLGNGGRIPCWRGASDVGWQTWVFDCDGVILNSNPVKTNAMFHAAQGYGNAAAEKLREYHVRNGGVSRDLKFRWFFTNVVTSEPDIDWAVTKLKCAYGEILEDELRACEVASGLHDLLSAMKADGASCFVVSGGDQDEVRKVLDEHGLAGYFNGVFGAPDSKEEIVAREVAAGHILWPAVMIGDSRYDYQVAAAYDMDFVFLTAWTDFERWREFFRGKDDVCIKKNINGVLHALKHGQGA